MIDPFSVLIGVFVGTPLVLAFVFLLLDGAIEHSEGAPFSKCANCGNFTVRSDTGKCECCP